MNLDLDGFREIWLIDFEFNQPPGERPTVLCMVAKEWRTGRMVRMWADEISNLSAPPFEITSDILFIAYYASAEMNCFLSLGWHLSCHVLDLYVEFRNMTNGRQGITDRSLLGALYYFGLDGLEAVEKDEMRQLAIRGGSYTQSEKAALLDYCESDVRSLEKLFSRMQPSIDFPRAVCRGHYMKAVSVMESIGIPMDTTTLTKLNRYWDTIKEKLICEIDSGYNVYDGTRFSMKRFENYVSKNRISWQRLDSGRLALDDDTFRGMSKSYPIIAPLQELRYTLGTMRLFEFPVGQDGRNRCMLSPFSSKTSRNQPSNTKFPFGPSVWIRGLIKPQPGMSLAYIDWSQQEFGIAAALSGDEAMKEAYRSGDPYLTFAKQAKTVPPDATKSSHGAKREQFKQCALAVQYGMGGHSLAITLGESEIIGQHLLRLHKDTYPVYWRWSGSVVNHALLGNPIKTVFGWTLNPTGKPNTRSLANFPIQANGAEMLRLAIIWALERRVRVCAPIHDALLIEAPTAEIEASVTITQQAMQEASRVVLGDLELRSDVKYVHYPDRYMDARGIKMWEQVMALIAEIENPCH